MSTIWGRNIKHLCEITGTSGAKLSRVVGVSGATVSDWKRGEIKEIESNNLIRVAEFFHVSPQALIQDDLTTLTVGELHAPYKVNRKPHSAALQHVPVVGTAQLGDDGFWTEFEYPVGHGDGFVLYPTTDSNAFGLHVEGDSMRPRYKPGEVVIVSPNRNPEPGHEVAVKSIDGRVMVKVLDWRRNGMVQLSSVNEDHKPITLKDEQVAFIYRVVGSVQSDMRHY